MTDNLFHTRLAQSQPFVTGLFSAALLRSKLAHAYLLVGRADQDKWQFARETACVLNCRNVKERAPLDACVLTASAEDAEPLDTTRFCQNCRWIWEAKHPQAWLTLSGETTKSGKIAVEKARQLSDELAKESQFTRCVIIEDASQESFHRPAANALLKTIEDPKVNCLFLLFALSADDVLPTVVSRCQVVPFCTIDSAGASLRKNDLSRFAPEAINLAREAVDHHIRRRDSQALARLLDFSRRLNELISDDFSGNDVIDLLVAVDIDRLGPNAAASKEDSIYLKNLLALSQSSKEQLEHYVSPKAAMESFALSWWRLATQVPVAR
jgi:DNA polymerase-3 subunit delta'